MTEILEIWIEDIFHSKTGADGGGGGIGFFYHIYRILGIEIVKKNMIREFKNQKNMIRKL